MLFLSLLTTPSTQAQTPVATTFSGNATGVIANANAVGGLAVVNATVAPTGALTGAETLAPAGGRRTNQVALADVFAGLLGTTNTLTTGVVTTRTSGGTAGATDGGTANTSQSQAVVNNLNLSLLTGALTVTADTLTANTNCTCGPNCTGDSVITNLRINGRLVGGVGGIAAPAGVIVSTDANGNVILTAAPNTGLSVFVPNVGTINLILNQQTRNPAGNLGNITVNALFINVNTIGNLVSTNISVAQAHSDITCAAAVAGADLAVNKTSTINGNTITNTITVTNNGAAAATGVVITDALPAGTTFVSATGPVGTTFVSPAVGTNGTVTATLGSSIAANGGTATITIISSVPAGTTSGTTFGNTATATATNDATPHTSNTTSVTFVPVVGAGVADLAVTKTSTISGNTITNTITVTNNGPNTATNVVVTDVLPAETFFLSSSSGSGFALTNPGFGQNGTVTGTLGSLAPNASASFTVVSEVFQSTNPGTVVTNTATVTSSATDLFTANNTATTNVFVGFAPSPNNFAPAFSGRAIGAAADADVNIFGLVTATARVGIADTGPLPSTGGRIVVGPITTTANVALGGGLTTVLAGSVFNSRTSGGIPGIPDGGNLSTSQSQATVTNLNILAGGIAIGATALTANTNCACGTICTGTSTIAGLTVAGTPINIVNILGNATLTAPPNTEITLTVGGSTVTLILNEQIIGNGSITVNALRVLVTVGGIVTSNVVVAQAHSDIACFTGRPTAAGVSIAGRVLSPSGRGISRARVLLTDSTGQTRSVMTNPFGYYSFGNVEVGGTYIFEVRDKRYTFTPQTISLTEGVTNFNFKAQQ